MNLSSLQIPSSVIDPCVSSRLGVSPMDRSVTIGIKFGLSSSVRASTLAVVVSYLRWRWRLSSKLCESEVFDNSGGSNGKRVVVAHSCKIPLTLL
jgi:hypothetical protein